jgi:two-component system, chemotaxis family, protein-glutamate methylesterase/glutaminase
MTRAVARKGGTKPKACQPIRLMIIDDSLVARTALRRIVEGGNDMEVVAAVNNAEAALEVLRSVQVDAILLDLEMPGMGGLKALPKIVTSAPRARILVVSSLTIDGADQTLAALSLGATAALPKPNAFSFTNGYRDMLLGKIRALGRAPAGGSPSPRGHVPGIVARAVPAKPARALAIGASTGGIHALVRFFAALSGPVNVPIFITQHLPGAFMPAFARQLTMTSGYDAVVADEDMPIRPGRIHIAPGDAHMTMRSVHGRLIVRLDRTPVSSGCTPSVDPMFASMANEFGEHALGVVLSGMGRDGSQGAAKIVAAGGSIFAQDETSCAVWGMPRAVAEAGLASAILPPEEIACRVSANIGSRHGIE